MIVQSRGRGGEGRDQHHDDQYHDDGGLVSIVIIMVMISIMLMKLVLENGYDEQRVKQLWFAAKCHSSGNAQDV